MPSIEELRERERHVASAGRKLERKAKRLGVRIEDLRDERQETREAAKDKRQRERELERAIADKRAELLWRERACIDGATTWLGLKLVIVTVGAKGSWRGTVNSADRTSHADDCGDKLSQAELWALFQSGQGAPANPPGTGTHEGICDDDFARLTGRRIGSELPPHMWGLDLSDGPTFEREADRLGFRCVRPYPDESWHVNLLADPTPTLKRLGVV